MKFVVYMGKKDVPVEARTLIRSKFSKLQTALIYAKISSMCKPYIYDVREIKKSTIVYHSAFQGGATLNIK